jgi:hypothetical protein
MDRALGAQGWVSAAVARLQQPRWEPWKDGTSARDFDHRWPGAYQGTVWVRVVPVPLHVGEEHLLVLRWGPWRRTVEVVLERLGVLLTTGKSRDPSANGVTLHLRSDRPVYCAFGAGEVPDQQPQQDIRDGWVRQE